MGAHDVVVIGAGLAGLRCATRLAEAGRDVVVLEAADRVGGRERTDNVDGFLLDRGFHVLNPAYPAVKRWADVDALRMRSFPIAVRVFEPRSGGRSQTVEIVPPRRGDRSPRDAGDDANRRDESRLRPRSRRCRACTSRDSGGDQDRFQDAECAQSSGYNDLFYGTQWDSQVALIEDNVLKLSEIKADVDRCAGGIQSFVDAYALTEPRDPTRATLVPRWWAIVARITATLPPP